MSQECLVVFERVILITECIISSIDCINYILGTTCLHLSPPTQGRLNRRNWSGGREGRARQMKMPIDRMERTLTWEPQNLGSYSDLYVCYVILIIRKRVSFRVSGEQWSLL